MPNGYNAEDIPSDVMPESAGANLNKQHSCILSGISASDRANRLVSVHAKLYCVNRA